jgi:hypothetical protein
MVGHNGEFHRVVVLLGPGLQKLGSGSELGVATRQPKTQVIYAEFVAGRPGHTAHACVIQAAYHGHHTVVHIGALLH